MPEKGAVISDRLSLCVALESGQAVGGTEVNPIGPECRVTGLPTETSHENSLESTFHTRTTH